MWSFTSFLAGAQFASSRIRFSSSKLSLIRARLFLSIIGFRICGAEQKLDYESELLIGNWALEFIISNFYRCWLLVFSPRIKNYMHVEEHEKLLGKVRHFFTDWMEETGFLLLCISYIEQEGDLSHLNLITARRSSCLLIISLLNTAFHPFISDHDGVRLREEGYLISVWDAYLIMNQKRDVSCYPVDSN